MVVVGNAQQLTIAKEVSVVGGGAAVQGATLEYVVRVTNSSLVPALYVVITDDLNVPVPGYLTLVPDSATLNGQTTGITVANQLITADYFTTYGPLQPQGVVTLRFRAVINPDLLDGTRIVNTGTATWDNPPRTASASVAIDVGAIPGQGILNGQGVARRELQPDARSERAHPRRLDSPAVSQRPAAAQRDHRRERRVSHRRHPAELHQRRAIRTALHRARRDCEQREAGHGVLAVHERTAKHPRHHRAVREQPAGSEPADLAERPDLQLRVARSGGRCHVAHAELRHSHFIAGCVLRRSGAAESSYACRRLLPVRHEFFGPGVPERREFPDRRESAADRLRRHVFSDHPADLGPVDRRVLGSRVPRRHRRCTFGDAGLLRDPDLRVRADPGCARTQPRNALSRAPETRRQPDPGFEPDLQQPHPGGSGSAGRNPDLEDDAAAQRRARSARAVRHHIQERDGCADVRREHRGSHPGGLPLCRRLGAHRSRTGRAGSGRP